MLSRNALILSSISLTALAAAPAFAQTASPVDTTPQKTAEGEQNPPTGTPTNAKGQPATTGSIVVTGSRIRRNNFNTPQNVDIITRDDQVLAGSRSTADVLQSATVTSGTSQINGSFLGFLSDNGTAASTVGLRGLGSSRTLVLLNGRRLAPAGVGPQLVAADLNVLPTSIVQRIEVLREGASSIYGSDAIAGVINIITDTSINGITVDAYADHPIYAGSGDVRRASITAGKTFARGHITASVEVRDDEGMTLGDRPDTSCPRELAFINGQEVGQTVPGGTALRCFPFARGGGGVAAGYGFAAGFQTAIPSRITYPGYLTGNPDIFSSQLIGFSSSQLNLRPESPPILLDQTVFSPVRTYTGYANGAYDLGFLGDAELYGEGLFTRRKSHQAGIDRPSFQYGTNPNAAQLFGGTYTYNGHAYGVGDLFGLPVSPFFPVAWANAGVNYFSGFVIPNQTIENKQQVDFWRLNGGLRGSVGLGDWRYDANVQVSHTKGRDDRQTPIAQRLTDVYVAVPAPTGTPSQYIVTAIPGETGAGNPFTCAANVTNGAYNGNTCVPLDQFNPANLLYGQVPQGVMDYLYPMVNYTKTKYRQSTLSLGFDGSLFPLPGGDVKGAVGFEHRYDFIDDTPGAERQAGTLAYYGTASETTGHDKVDEAYAEIDAPIFKDRPFFNLLEVQASGRYTHYQSYGSGWTYHVNAQWAPIEAIRLRGNYGTNFRAPNLYEQFVAAQVGFYPENGTDPCANFGTSLSPGNPVYDNCLAQLTPILGTAGALAFAPNGGSIQVTTSGGRGVLKAEKARTYGFGGVLTVPRHIADLTLAVDYWHVAVKGEVNTLGNLILNFCYQSTDFPNNPYCAFIGPRLTLANAPRPDQAGSLTTFNNPYLNIAQQVAAGIDFDARFATPIFGGRFQTQLQATRNLVQDTEFFPGQGLQKYNGTLGYPGNGAGPHWVGSLDTRFTTSNHITFRWGVQYVGPSHSEPLSLNLKTLSNGNLGPCAAGSAGCNAVTFDLRAEPYWEHGASVQFQWPTVGQLTIGMNNIFNAKPPTISDDRQGYPRIGNFFGSGPYSYRGRSIFANVTRTFK